MEKIEFKTSSGKTFKLSLIPAYYAHSIYGDLLPLLREYGTLAHLALPIGTVLKILSFVEVQGEDGATYKTDTETGINKAFANKKDYVEVLKKMIDWNFGFFLDGSLPTLSLKTKADEDK